VQAWSLGPLEMVNYKVFWWTNGV